jgi:acyl-CoA synthetase (AMP-forming)/AMP-acid ligase II
VCLPVYGLAEGSLAVTFPPLDRQAHSVWVNRESLGAGVVEVVPEGSPSAREIVSVGAPVTGADVRLVDDEGHALAEDAAVTGEIQIRGTSVMREYEADDSATRATVHDGGWVSTGDLGFWYHGELHVAGRRKEMVIVFGQNYYASDIETIVGSVPGLSGHSVLAAGMPSAETGEGLLVFIETNVHTPEEKSELVGRIRLVLSNALGITPQEILLVGKGTLPRTSSGKVQRHGIEQLYRRYASNQVPSDPRTASRAPAGQPSPTATDRHIE